MDEPQDGLHAGHAGADEDGRDDEQARGALGTLGPHQERDAQRNRRQRVPVVVNEVGEQGYRARQDEDDRLRHRGQTEDAQ